jgi:hypothetical protein
MKNCPTCSKKIKVIKLKLKPTIPATKTFDNKARLAILREIMSCWQQVAQWDKWGYDTKDNVVKNQHQAAVLIELLEVDDCGSVGGFDGGNKPGRETKNWVFNRFLAVLRKYHTESDMDKKDSWKVADYIEFFGAPNE